MRANIKDVSQAAGVSIKTVSRVINNERYVRPATRARVEEAMAALGFHPSQAARALAGGRSFQIALVCSNPGPYYLHGLIAGLRGRCAAEGVRLIVHAYEVEADELGADVLTFFRQMGFDGAILTPPIVDNAPVLDELDRAGTPYVRISPGVQRDRSASVAIDNEGAARAMTRRLIALGHRRIGFVVGHRSYAVSNQRLAGYLDALREAGIPLDLNLVEQGWFDFGSGRAAAEALLGLPEPPTAIFASSDDMAAGVLSVAHQRRIRVPEQLSIAGFDDTDLAKLVWPPLTTMRQPIRAMAERAAELLFSGTVEQVVLPSELIERASTAPRWG
ncbi:LacI family DNA-binding transcriptional regulator [Sphingomonas sp. MAH-20]|uniref:LacI family DNA-binding transcriptional regulator n=2 Tax=Sphingomonas TaxID=13687 RepID=A0A6I4IYA6_9SPHN|nr:LacI family DNA-binding transcriptional regulator [Sphingomonas horti]MBA2918244.1 LacI family DNA-binding transcriptional regulator [Sphingomonas sp. CGMCC 1.13658]MVO77212.1 LacI family DNA-binding transcriptional regulator [Sphingomonas horti]